MKEEKIYTDEQQAVNIPFFAHEATVDRLERINKRWFIAFLIMLAMLFITNGAWLIYENQYQDEVYTYSIEQDSGEGGENTYTNNRILIGGDFHGEADSYGNGEAQDEEVQQQDQNVPDL